MSDNPYEVFYDAVSDSVDESKANSQNEFSEYENAGDIHRLYFELEQEGSTTSSDEGSQDEERNYPTTANNMKRINTAIKSKIDDLNFSRLFGGKTKAERQGKEEKSSYTVVANGTQGNIKAKLEQSTSQPQPVLLAERGATSCGSEYEFAVCGGSGDNLLPAANSGENFAPFGMPDMSIHAGSFQARQNYSFATNNDTSVYELAHPVPAASRQTDTIKSTTSFAPSVNKGCLEGVGQAVPVDFINPVQNVTKDNEKSSEYERLYFKSVDGFTESLKEKLKSRGYRSLASFRSEIKGQKSEASSEDQEIYSVAGSQDDDGFSLWGSEFDETSSQEEMHAEVEGQVRDEAPNKPLPPKPGTKPFMLRAKFVAYDSKVNDDPSSTACLPVIINPEKHPPPVLPPQPSWLTPNQIKRRMVIESIIISERSYLESLERVVKEYEKPILELVSVQKSSIPLVFTAMKEIISHHKMFQIELSECVKTWDNKEKIGDIFTASFSKTMLINAYSIYVNSFAAAMEEIRSLQRSKQSFQDFIQKQEKLSVDRLPIFGLMVKPVQRFPQFIMFLQDLIKFTPQDHVDRRALQLALTELENVAYRLNERKRQSEQKFQANQTIQQMIKQKVQHVLTSWNHDLDPKRKLIRTDAVDQVQGEFENMKCKKRRLILMNDLVLCVKVAQKEQSGYTVERLVLRWMAKVKDLELKDTAITPNMQSVIKHEPGKFHIISSQPEKPEEDPFHLYADLHDMVHDHTVLGQISALLSTLKCSYAGHGLREELMYEVSRDLQRMIQIKEEQLRLVNSCSIILQDNSRFVDQGLREELMYEVSRDLQRMIQIKEEQLRLVNSCSIILQDNSRSDKAHYVLQTQTAGIKQDWCTDFMMAKLSLDRSNNLAWDGTSGSDSTDFDFTPAHFMKHLPVDVPKNYTKVKCAVSIFLNPEKTVYGIGVQHLWVCSSTPTHGQVSVLSVHNSKPSLMESFKACSSDILAAELVPGCGEVIKAVNFLFPEDTVWLTTSHREILIFPLTSEDGVHRQPLAVVRTPAVTVSVKFVDERLFCGFDDGFLTVYSRKADGSWNISEPVSLTFGIACVRLHFVHEENIWLSCSNKLFQLEIDSLETQATFVLNSNHDSPIDQIVKSGVGIWVSFHDSSVIKLFHLETMENLQEISVGNFVNRIRSEKLWSISGAVDNLVVTSLNVTRGLLWIGTSLGIVLTVPLPRLSDGVPLYRGRPKVSLHAHRGPVRFLIPLHCSSNILELTRASSLRSTLSARQSRRNQEREKLELEESEKRKARVIKAENVKSFDIIAQGQEPMSRDYRKTTAVDDITVSKKEKAEVLPSNYRDSEMNILGKGRKISANRTENKPEAAHKSKTISFRTELAQRIQQKSNTVSRSGLDATSLEALEVEELYDILLEDEADMGDEEDDDDNEDIGVASAGEGDRWSSGSMMPTVTFDSNPKQEMPSWLNRDLDHRAEIQDVGVELLSAQARPPYPVPASTFHSDNRLQNSTAESSPLVRDFVRNGSTRLTTIRRTGNNAVIVLSGGDGYCDLDLSRNQAKLDDACVLLWIHKF